MGELDLPYHLASSSLTGDAGAGFGLDGAAGFFPKSATVLKVAGLEAEGGADLEEKLRGFLSISETPREAAAVEAAREAMGGEDEGLKGGKKNEEYCVNGED